MNYFSVPPKEILIIGGGTAGWISALFIAKNWIKSGTNITVIDSEDIGIIGVGEGSTVAMKHFFDKMQIPENEWMDECQATYKAGICFPNWTNNAEYKSYFHPFFSKYDRKTGDAFMKNADIRRQGYNLSVQPEDFFLAAVLGRDFKSPSDPAHLGNNVVDYAYHFDSMLVGKFLRKKAIALGVKHINGTVEEVNLHSDGSVTSVVCKEHGTLSAELFIDCTGFRSLLIEKSLKVPFYSYGNTLLNDRAVAMPTYNEDLENLPPFTESRGLSCGWRWRIPLTNRYGNGYVYSSAHLTEQEAEDELRKSLGDKAKDSPANHLKMRVGRTEKHVSKNCLAVGLSQGFIEPLEASALQLVFLTLGKFVNDINESAFDEEKYNAYVNGYFDGTLDYIATHYKINSRDNNQYWRDAREGIKISPFVNELLHKWKAGDNIIETLSEGWEHPPYVISSWYCLLAGKGYFPKATKRIEAKYVFDANKARNYLNSIAIKFPQHNELLK